MYRTFPPIALPGRSRALCILLVLFIMPELGLAAQAPEPLDLTQHWAGYSALFVFVMAYVLVVLEERLHLRKSKPVIVAAGIIWALIAAAEVQNGTPGVTEEAFLHHLLEFAEIFLFLLAAMTYVNTLAERRVFEVLRSWLVSQGFSLRTIFWLTGLLAFFLSPVIDNLTTALVMATVVMAVGGNNRQFVVVACINVVVAANAGGAFSPFGDITTLMVWQEGLVDFREFFALFFPSLVNWLIPATFMAFAIPKERPPALDEHVTLKRGAWIVMGLFIITIILAVSFHSFLHLPPVLGMMTGLGLLQFFGYYLKSRDQTMEWYNEMSRPSQSTAKAFDIYEQLKRAEWDTLMFFYGIILCVGGLGTLGYLALGSQWMYGDLGPTTANILVGLLSAFVDNIPVMVAVLSMEPDMGLGQWLLVTLTAGVGGSLLSIGSAAGVAVMGQARGIYTFLAHLKWSWAIALGYGASIWVHLTLNAEMFQ